MKFPTDILRRLSDELPPAAFRVLRAIIDLGSESRDDPMRIVAPKDTVLNRLREAEGAIPQSDALRQRIQQIRNLISSDARFQSQGQPFFEIRSRKVEYELIWQPGALEHLALESTREAVLEGGRDDYNENVGGNEIDLDVQSRQFKVLVSHNGENDHIDGVLFEFVEDLQRHLDKLPARYASRFSVKLLYDAKRDMHGRSEFEPQMDRLCADSAMAIFMTSNGWMNSKACQYEARHFLERERVDAQAPFVAIQLCGTRDELKNTFHEWPNYPSMDREFSGYRNLIELWEGQASIRERFLELIRDQIVAYLDMLPAQTPVTSVPKQAAHDSVKLRHLVAEHVHHYDNPDDKLVEGFVSHDGGDDNTVRDEDRRPAVETLLDWATNPHAEDRMVVLLGGFGMGKTTTVQGLHKRLRDLMGEEFAPTPIYLDFRRLIPGTEHGRGLSKTLPEIIAEALHSRARQAVTGEQVIDLVQKEPCVVIFDGLDEVGNRIGREYATQLYRQLLELIPSDVQAEEASSGKVDWQRCQTRIVLTCRTHFFRSLREQNAILAGSHRRASRLALNREQARLPGISIFRMAPLRPSQIRELFARHLGEDQGRETYDLIADIHDLPGLASRPVMARFISEIAGQLIVIHQQGQPINIATIYEELFQLGLDRDAEKRPLLKPNDRHKILTALAEHLHRNSLGPQSADALETWFDGFARGHDGIRLILDAGPINTRDLLHTELENASFLVRNQSDRFGFAHTSYFEYFLAGALVSACVEDRLGDWVGHPSVETLDFVIAILERDGRESELRGKLISILTSDGPLNARRFAFDVLRRKEKLVMPVGANLSGFDLQHSRIQGEAWVRVNLSGTRLNSLSATDMRFVDCNFDGTALGNARLDNTRFEGVAGIPLGLKSARGKKCALPDKWQDLLIGREAYWSDLGDYCEREIAASAWVNSVAHSPDGRCIVTGSDDSTARVWDPESGAVVMTLEGHGGLVTSVGYSPDGAHIVTGSDDGTARVWDPESGAVVMTLEGHGGSVTSVGYSPDGGHIVTGSDDETARVWDSESGAVVMTLEGHGVWVTSVGYSPMAVIS